MRGIVSLAKMTMANLREVIDVMERRAEGDPADTSGWTREQLIQYIEALRPVPPTRRPRPERVRKARMKKNLGVGKFCLDMLARVVGRTLSDAPVGLSYNKMVQMAQKKFPDSAVDERHLRWYAAKARRDGLTIPVERERSRWM